MPPTGIRRYSFGYPPSTSTSELSGKEGTTQFVAKYTNKHPPFRKSPGGCGHHADHDDARLHAGVHGAQEAPEQPMKSVSGDGLRSASAQMMSCSARSWPEREAHQRVAKPSCRALLASLFAWYSVRSFRSLCAVGSSTSEGVFWIENRGRVTLEKESVTEDETSERVCPSCISPLHRVHIIIS